MKYIVIEKYLAGYVIHQNVNSKCLWVMQQEMILVFFLYICKNIYCFIGHKRNISSLWLLTYQSLVSAKNYGGQVSVVILHKEHNSQPDVKGGIETSFTDENLTKIPGGSHSQS